MTAKRRAPGAAPVRDLGEIMGPVLCFGGPYSNLQATEAVLAEAERRGIPPGRVICTGDVVAYGGDARATTDRVRRAGIHVVLGNCEESLGFSAADCGCGFEAGSECAAWADAWYAHAMDAVADDQRAWMRALPRQLRFTLAGRRFAVIHGGDENISEYVFASTPAGRKAAALDRLARSGAVDGVVAGHAGLPFTQVLGAPVPDGRLWHNAGAVGMPANDGTPRGWFSTLTPRADGIEVALHPLAYDHAAAARALRRAHGAAAYADALVDGLWPNMSVLPAAERRQRARPLDPRPVLWAAHPGSAAASAVAV